MEDFRKSYEDWMVKRKQGAIDRILHNKKILFNILKINKIENISVTFDGHGDSGSVTELITKPAEHNVLTEPVFGVRILKHISFSPDGIEFVYEEDNTIQNLIESICYDFLEYEHVGWETNEGSYGDFYFDVSNERIHFEHNERNTNFYEHEL